MTPHPHSEFLHALADGRGDEFECQHDQTALELCEICGWKTLIPGEGCLNCQRKAVQPAWHDRPTQPGLWLHRFIGFHEMWRIYDLADSQGARGRFFGPLPEDRK